MAETMVHPRPGMATILKSDSNANGNFVEEIEFNRSLRRTKFPTIRGPQGNYDFPSFQARHKDSSGFVKWNKHSQAPHQNYPLTPHRDDHEGVDPTSGFLGPGNEVDLNKSPKRIPTMNQLSDKVQETTPSTQVVGGDRPQTPPKPTSYEPSGAWSSIKVSVCGVASRAGRMDESHKDPPQTIQGSRQPSHRELQLQPWELEG
uniref:Uncharacterized protein n=1 Tax=Ciona savignyi TaxID=51511 RepID=H2Y6N3_CIOSA